MEKVNTRLNNLCVLIGPPRIEIIYRHNNERFRFSKRDWRLVLWLHICQRLRKTTRTYKSIKKTTRTPTSFTDIAYSRNMVSWQESALSATTSSWQRSVLITTKRMEDAQYTNVSILLLIWVGATQHHCTRNEHFFRNRATYPWQRGTNSKTNETKARSCRAMITDSLSRITGFARNCK